MQIEKGNYYIIAGGGASDRARVVQYKGKSGSNHIFVDKYDKSVRLSINDSQIKNEVLAEN